MMMIVIGMTFASYDDDRIKDHGYMHHIMDTCPKDAKDEVKEA